MALRKIIYLTEDEFTSLAAGNDITVAGQTVYANKLNEYDIRVKYEPSEGTVDFEDLENRPKYNGSLMTGNTNIPEVKTSTWDSKSVVSGTNDGTNWTKITIDGTQKNIPNGVSDFNDLTNRPKYNGSVMTSGTDIPEVPDVIDNVSSTSTTDALSAKQGKALNDRIDALSSRGKFLAIWNPITGKPTSEPEAIPYAYTTGDYFVVAYNTPADYDSTHTYNKGDVVKYNNNGYVCNTNNTTGTWNPAMWDLITALYIPNGTSYTGQASTTAYDGDPEDLIDSTYFFDGTTWHLQIGAGGGKVKDVQIDGTSILSNGVANIPTSDGTNKGLIKNIKMGSGTATPVSATVNNGEFTLPNASSSSVGVIGVGSGLTIQTNGFLNTNPASDSMLVQKNNGNYPIVPAKLDKAVMEGLGNNSLTWSDTYKANARNTIGAGTGNSTVTVSTTGTSDVEVKYITINNVEHKLPEGQLVEIEVL